MILEVEMLVDRIAAVIAETLPEAAVNVPADALNEAHVTHVVPSAFDGDLVIVEGTLSIDVLARAVAEEIIRGGHETNA